MTMIIDIFMAGAASTSTVLNCALMTLVTYPEIQKRIHVEIDEAFPDGQSPSMIAVCCLTSQLCCCGGATVPQVRSIYQNEYSERYNGINCTGNDTYGHGNLG